MKYKIIKSLAQYNKYCNIHEALIIKDDQKLVDEIELLELLIEDYNQRIMREKTDKLKPVELLRTLMDENNITQTELAKSIDISRQLINDVLGYRRNISKELMKKLSNYFSMNQEAFSREYDLNSNKNKLSNIKKSMGNN